MQAVWMGNNYRKALYNVKRFENGLVTSVNQTNDRVRFRLSGYDHL